MSDDQDLNLASATECEREKIRREIIDDLDEEFELSLEEEVVAEISQKGCTSG
ncbi:hypothetical protein [Acetobacter senegalensis]|uniref:hypothetical protein n=1 Tax=Acetobacter senegalensis TaxID=446692 RepID=UPI001D038568|nr:hypothetical protein [Acetobacter senegalensis]